jgi:hypothetical protein
MRRPIFEEPVKESMETSGWLAKRSPISAPRPVTRLSTPGGSPASSSARTNSVSTIGSSEGPLATTVLPAAIAGMIFDAERKSG